MSKGLLIVAEPGILINIIIGLFRMMLETQDVDIQQISINNFRPPAARTQRIVIFIPTTEEEIRESVLRTQTLGTYKTIKITLFLLLEGGLETMVSIQDVKAFGDKVFINLSTDRATRNRLRRDMLRVLSDP